MRSLTRALHLYEQLQRYSHPVRLKTIAEDCGISASTALRILKVLQDFGFVSQTDKNYRVGPGALPAARVFLESDPLPQVARPILEELSVDTGITASLYSRLGFERVLIERSLGSNPPNHDLSQGHRLPLVAGAAGKVLLQTLDDTEIQHVVDQSIQAGYLAQEFTIGDLRLRLTDTDNAYALSTEERVTGIVSIAVPVPTDHERPTEALSLSAPASDISRDQILQHLSTIQHSAVRLARQVRAHIY